MEKKYGILICSLLVLFGLGTVFGQSNTMASGGEASGSDGSMSYSVGQIDYIYMTGSGGSANQGVQQPFEFFVLGNDEFPEILLEMAVFPNPTSSFVTLQIGDLSSANLLYQLYDMHGRLLKKEAISLPRTRIDMENYASAMYLLHVSDSNRNLKSFRIIKK